MAETEKLVIISTTGIDNAEKATLPFVVATAALTVDVEVVLILQSAAVMLAKKGMADHVNAPGFMSMKNLLQNFLDLGGKVMLCSPCVKDRNIAPEDFIEGAQLVAAGSVVEEVMSAKSVLTY